MKVQQPKIEESRRWLISIFIIAISIIAQSSFAYNWEWDQGHDCVQVGGEWGRWGYTPWEWIADPCCACQACPVFVRTGSFQKIYSDLVISGVGPELSVTRAYNSDDISTGLFGYGWSLTFGKQLLLVNDNETGDRYVIVKEPTGQKYTLGEQASGVFSVTNGPGVTFSLVRNDDGTFTLTESEGTVRYYSSDGHLTSIVDRNGNELTIQYDSQSGCPEGATDAAGRSIYINIGPNGKIASIEDFTGRIVSYGYSSAGDLISVTDPMGNTTNYFYDAQHRLTSIIDPLGNTILNVTYDSQNRVYTYSEGGQTFTMTYYDGKTIKTDAQGNSWTYFFDDNGFIWKEIDPLGNIHTRQHNLITSKSLDQETFGACQESYSYGNTSYTWNDISGTGSPGPYYDDSYVTASMGFNFPFFGDSYSSVRISSNGYLTFGTDAIDYSNDPIPSGILPNNYIAPYWDDLHPSGGAIYYQTVGTAPDRQFIVQWDNVRYYYSSNRETFQVILHEGSGKIIFSYASTSYGGSSATIGIENGDGSGGLQISYNQTVVSAGTSFEIYIPECGDEATYHYTFDEHGNRTSVTDPMGNTTSYTYTSDNKVETITDPLGVITRYEYDADGNLTAEFHAYGTSDETQISYTYDDAGNMLTKTDPLGNTWVYTYDIYGNVLTETDPLGNITTYTYDDFGNVQTRTDPQGNISSFAYDLLGRLIGHTNPMGNSEVMVYDANGNVTTYTDAAGNQTEYEYDSRNRLIRKILPSSDTIRATYNSMDLPTLTVNAAGQYTYLEYDALGRLTRLIQKVNDTGPTPDNDDIVYALGYDNLNQIYEVGPGGDTTFKEYDILDRRVRTTLPNGSVIQTEYDAVGRMVRQSIEDGLWTEKEYDVLGRTTAIRDSAGTVWQYTYDAKGQVISQTDGEGKVYSFQYDAAGNQTIVFMPDGTTRQYEYDATGAVTAIVEAGGGRVEYVHDALGNVIQWTGLSGEVYSVARDALGNVTAATGPNGQTVNYTRDELGMPVNATWPDGSQQFYSFDAAGNIQEFVNRRGDTLRFEYNDLGQVISRLYPDGELESYAYDENGRLLTAQNSQGQISFAYDAVGRIITETVDGKSIQYAYDEAARSRTITYPNGHQVTQGFDERDRLTQVSVPSVGIPSIITYEGNNRIADIAYANGVNATYSYNANNQLDRLQYTSPTEGSLLDFSTLFSDAGFVAGRRNYADVTNSENYTFDIRNRLIEYNQGEMDADGTIPVPDVTIDYALDEMSNWTTYDKTGTSQQSRTVNAYNQYTEIGGVSLTYDADGNLTSDGSLVYEYDVINRLRRVLDQGTGAVIATYGYDALGRRITKTVGTDIYKYYYDTRRQLLEIELDGSSLVTIDQGPFLDNPIALHSNGQQYYYIMDNIGNVVGLTDTAGYRVESYRYDPYGNLTILDNTGTPMESSAFDNPVYFAGAVYDEETGFFNMRNRYYSPTLGRFTTPDPLGFVAGMNVYEYAASNPIMFNDPWGLSTEENCYLTSSIHIGGEKIDKLLQKLKPAFKVLGISFSVQGSLKFSASLCEAECCDPSNQLRKFKYREYEIEGSIGGKAEYNVIKGVLMYFGIPVPGWVFDSPGHKIGIFAYVELTLAANYKWDCQLNPNTCEKTCPQEFCIKGSGKFGLWGGAEVKVWFITAELSADGSITIGPKVCFSAKGVGLSACFNGDVVITAKVTGWGSGGLGGEWKPVQLGGCTKPWMIIAR